MNVAIKYEMPVWANENTINHYYRRCFMKTILTSKEFAELYRPGVIKDVHCPGYGSVTTYLLKNESYLLVQRVFSGRTAYETYNVVRHGDTIHLRERKSTKFAVNLLNSLIAGDNRVKDPTSFSEHKSGFRFIDIMNGPRTANQHNNLFDDSKNNDHLKTRFSAKL